MRYFGRNFNTRTHTAIKNRRGINRGEIIGKKEKKILNSIHIVSVCYHLIRIGADGIVEMTTFYPQQRRTQV